MEVRIHDHVHRRVEARRAVTSKLLLTAAAAKRAGARSSFLFIQLWLQLQRLCTACISASVTIVLLQVLFEQFAGTNNAGLLKEQKESGPLFSLSFMHWLDEAEQSCSDPDRKEQLGALAGSLLAAGFVTLAASREVNKNSILMITNTACSRLQGES